MFDFLIFYVFSEVRIIHYTIHMDDTENRRSNHEISGIFRIDDLRADLELEEIRRINQDLKARIKKLFERLAELGIEI